MKNFDHTKYLSRARFNDNNQSCWWYVSFHTISFRKYITLRWYCSLFHFRFCSSEMFFSESFHCLCFFGKFRMITETIYDKKIFICIKRNNNIEQMISSLKRMKYKAHEFSNGTFCKSFYDLLNSEKACGEWCLCANVLEQTS